MNDAKVWHEVPCIHYQAFINHQRMDTLVSILNDQSSSSDEIICQCLDEFLVKNEKIFAFSDCDVMQHNKVLQKLSSIVASHDTILGIKAFNVMRLLSRDRILVLNITIVSDLIEIVVRILNSDDIVYGEPKYHLKVESLKCLCNWLYHSAVIRKHFIDGVLWKPIIEDLSKGQLYETQFYEIRVLFLMSALESNCRSMMVEDNTVGILVNVLSTTVPNISKNTDNNMALNIACEVLKSLFNIMLELSETGKSGKMGESKNINQTKNCKTLVVLLRQMLLDFHPFTDSTMSDLLTHILHMFVNIPKDAITELVLTVANGGKKNEEKDKPIFFIIDSVCYDMRAVKNLLQILSERIEIKSYIMMKEKTLSVLTSFCYICRINPVIRKYLRQQVLPPLKPSRVNPEERIDLCGQIVRLMTTVDVPLKNMAADFLYVLCKENSERLIRYAGYGNSAGFLASRGLMIPSMTHADGEYSEDELSDIEGEIDPMTGAIPRPQENPMANMSESEKEAEMEKLMCMMDRLRDLNVIRPMSVNSDGKLSELRPTAAADSDGKENEDDGDVEK